MVVKFLDTLVQYEIKVSCKSFLHTDILILQIFCVLNKLC
ncbi:hypothetical protein T4D_8383 [Trichinella pseudospiralis]|uniref:Uncharacterized protein n=1 Tax=Trichinella pseudospiralis TaxID=6337 RepID=A0A0V1F3Q5_TRIPS|nr:hypothetical protein T4D_8383 [Trichinella pseudospiralis]